MKTQTVQDTHFFVDEAGDPVFYNARGELLVGTEGCSKILLVGFVSVADPEHARRELARLHAEIANDPFLAGIPSLTKTNVAFHAKDDVPEVREKVFKCIAGLDIRYHAVVARKIERNFVKKFGRSESEFYFYLVEKLFENVLHKAAHNHVYYAVRGNKTATGRFTAALTKAQKAFAKKWGAQTTESHITLYPQSPKGEACLEIVDYINWALQRAYVRGETRYIDFMQPKIAHIVDILDSAKYPHNYYNAKNPFSIHKTSPLQLDP